MQEEIEIIEEIEEEIEEVMSDEQSVIVEESGASGDSSQDKLPLLPIKGQ